MVAVMKDSAPPNASGASCTASASVPELRELTGAELEEALVLAQRRINAAEAERAGVISEMLDRASTPEHETGASTEEFVADNVAALLACTRAVANMMIDVTIGTREHPTLMRQWRLGHIDSRKVAVISDGLRHCDKAFSHFIVDQAITYAYTRTPSQLRLWLDRRLLAADPSLAKIRRARAVAERKVTLTPLADGMAELAAYLPAVQARQVYDTVNALATSAEPDDRRRIDQRRSDAFVDLVVGRADPPRVSVGVVVTAETLLETECEPGWVAGVGPIPGEEAQAMILAGRDTSWRRLLVDADSGVLTDVSERQYRPSSALARAVRARDLTCRFPGCRRSAVGVRNGTDLDHTVPWPEGATSASNLTVLCRHHHRLKHSTKWQVRTEAEGRMTWVTPGGRHIVTKPWEYLDRPPQPPD
jgi:hypothetical protein